MVADALVLMVLIFPMALVMGEVCSSSESGDVSRMLWVQLSSPTGLWAD
jgi:hypothetical protein